MLTPFHVTRYEDRKQPLQAAFVGLREVRFFVLRVDVQREQWHRLIVVVVDHSRAAPLALPWGCPTDLPHAPGSRHQPEVRIFGDGGRELDKGVHAAAVTKDAD